MEVEVLMRLRDGNMVSKVSGWQSVSHAECYYQVGAGGTFICGLVFYSEQH